MWTLRALLAAFLLLAVSGPSQSQETSTSEEAISRIIDRGFMEGHDNKVIGGIGDNAAVIVTKIVRGRNLSSAQIGNILIVLNLAFGGVTSVPDAEPKTALFVLRELELSTNSAQVKSRIAQTREYIEGEFSKSKKRSL